MTGLKTDHEAKLRDLITRLRAAKTGLETAVAAFNERVKAERKGVEDAVATYVGVVAAFESLKDAVVADLTDRFHATPDDDTVTAGSIDELRDRWDGVYPDGDMDATDILPDEAEPPAFVMDGDVADLESLLKSMS